MKSYLFIAITFVLIAILALSGCGETTSTSTQLSPATSSTTTTSTATTTSTSEPTPKTGGTLTLLWRGASGSLGWAAEGTSGEMIHTAQFFYEALVKDVRTGGELKYEPWLATSWDLAEDGKSVTFHLRNDVKFHDGTDFNAEAVKWNYEHLIASGKQPNWISVDVVDEYTARLNMTEWQNTAMYQFGNVSYIVSPTAYETNGVEWLNVHPVGTGPFVFESFEQDVSCKGVRNPDYWGEGPYLDGIEVKYVPDWSARKTAMQTGEGDMTVFELGKESFDMESLGFQLYTSAESLYSVLMSGANSDSPFANQKVREAVEYAIDREDIASGLGFGQWEAPYQNIPRSDSAWDPDFMGRKYDPEKAKELLKEAGYEEGFSTTLYPMPGSNSDCAIAVQDYLSKVGITVDIENWDPGRFFQFFNGQTWEGMVIAVMPTNGNYNFTLLMLYSGTRPIFVSSLITPQLKEVVMESLNSREIDISMIREAVQIMHDQCIAIPLYEAGLCVATHDYVHGGGIGERGLMVTLNPGTFWLDK